MSVHPDLKYPMTAIKPCSAGADHTHCTDIPGLSSEALASLFGANPPGCWAVSTQMIIHRNIQIRKSKTPARL